MMDSKLKSGQHCCFVFDTMEIACQVEVETFSQCFYIYFSSADTSLLSLSIGTGVNMT